MAGGELARGPAEPQRFDEGVDVGVAETQVGAWRVGPAGHVRERLFVHLDNGRDPRAQRVRQVDVAQVRRRHPAADPGRDRHAWPRGRAARAGRRLQPRADRPRERVHERGDSRVVEARHPAIFDEIVAFAELEKFIDMQVRHYSSGMYVRLGFAVAVNVEPDILLVDEVLSVGDEAFQRKCIERVKKFQQEGRTILFVTHAADLVRRICDRAIVLDHGEMVIDATPGEAVRVFRESLHGGELNELRRTGRGGDAAEEEGDGGARSRRDLPGAHHRRRDRPSGPAARSQLAAARRSHDRTGEYNATERTDDILFGIAIHDEDGNHLFGTNTAVLGVDVPPADGDGEMSFEFHRVPLLDGTYLVTPRSSRSTRAPCTTGASNRRTSRS